MSRRIHRVAPSLSRLRRKSATALAAASLMFAWAARPASAQVQLPGPFRNFESPQVHPLALTPDGTRLLAVNSPNATLSVFQLTSGSPMLTAEIPVGLEPVSVAARNDREAWVVNWLSDSVSVVDLTTGAVVRTIDVGDEPTDVLFAGSNNERAFVCVSGGPKHVAGDDIAGKGMGQVLVFDAAAPASPLFTIDAFGKQPRSLARDASGARVFVSVFESGNRTTVVPEPAVRVGGGLPPPNPSPEPIIGEPPSTGLVVRWDGSHWTDELSRAWDAFIPYQLLDWDVLVIDAVGNPAALASQVEGVGTHVGNMAYDPAADRVLAANLEDENQVRFEPNLRGRFQHSRVSIIDPTPGPSAAAPVHVDLNRHIDFSTQAGTAAERAQSLAVPGDIKRASDGTLYVAATSSAKVGVLDASAAVVGRIGVGSGPTGLALDEPRQRLYVLNRFDQTLGVVNTTTKTQEAVFPVGFNPEPAAVRAGRKHFADATRSAHGTVSCMSCHPSGHRDGMAWDLGDPRGATDFVQGFSLHPMKGPMNTQSLRGIIGTEPFHWRGDRVNLAAFNPTFVGLLGHARQLSAQEMAEFTAFIQSLTYPPNPNQNVDRTLSAKGRRGFDAFRLPGIHSSGLVCNSCHLLQAINRPEGLLVTGTGTIRLIVPAELLLEPQAVKIAQLRGLNQKLGMVNAPGRQLTGVGFTHDGTRDTLFGFLKSPVFRFPEGQAGDDMRRDIETFLLQLDSGLAPAVGMQVTLGSAGQDTFAAAARVQFLARQASAGNCDLVVRGLYGGRPRAFLRVPGAVLQPDSQSESGPTLGQLFASAAPGSELTFMGVPPGTGRRFSIDADGDGLLNDDEPRSSVSIEGRVVDAAGQGMAGVSVALTGAQTASALTDAQGRYRFNYVSVAGAHTVAPQGAAFTPASRTFTNPTHDQSAVFVASASANAADSSRFFVAQHYADFFGREPDAPGLEFWTNEIESCGADAACREVKRVNVSAAFFLSIEFQTTGYLVYRASKVSFGDLAGKPAPVTYERLLTDARRVGSGVVVGKFAWEHRLEGNTQAFFTGWVQRPEFFARYPLGMSALDFVNALNAAAGFPLTPPERDALVAQLSQSNDIIQGRAAVVRQMAENAELSRREFNRAFVLMQYFGYLRRNPDAAPDADFTGYHHWLDKLNSFNGNFVEAEMVKAFITSTEYRARFGQP